MSLTYFVAALICPKCGKVSPEDTSTYMSNHLLPDPGVYTLHEGDRADIGIGDVEDSYLRLSDPEGGSPVRILETWDCPSCGSANWALIVFNDWVLTSIKNVSMTVDTLRLAHFISIRIEEWYLDREGEVLFQGERPDSDLLPRLEASLLRSGSATGE